MSGSASFLLPCLGTCLFFRHADFRRQHSKRVREAKPSRTIAHGGVPRARLGCVLAAVERRGSAIRSRASFDPPDRVTFNFCRRRLVHRDPRELCAGVVKPIVRHEREKEMDEPIRPIRNEADYQAALAQVNALFNAAPGTAEGDRLEVLACSLPTTNAGDMRMRKPIRSTC